MCYLHYTPEMWEYDAPFPGPRPSPRIAWSLPVDIVELAVSLEAFQSQLAQNTTLRLCHRFGSSPLATLPQEILDLIIGYAHDTMKATLRGKWEQNYLCFQSRCSCYHHYSDVQDPNMAASLFRSIRPDEKMEEFTDDERMMLPEELTGSEDDYDYDEVVWDTHNDRQGKWLDQLCLCHKESPNSKAKPGFLRLYEVSRRHIRAIDGLVTLCAAVEISLRLGGDYPALRAVD